MQEEITQICFDCGEERYGKMKKGHQPTCWEGFCDDCGVFKRLTNPRDFRI